MRLLRGVTRTVTLTIKDASGVPLDLSAVELTVEVIRDGSADKYVPTIAVEGDAHNLIVFTWPADKQKVGLHTIDVRGDFGVTGVSRTNWHGSDGIVIVEWARDTSAREVADLSVEEVSMTGTMETAAAASGGNYYVKPEGGIPASDLAQAVQDSLDLADAAYQKPQYGIPESDLAGEVKVKLKETLYISSLPTSDITSTDDLNDVISRSTLLKLAEGESSALIYNQLTEYGMSESDFAQTECVITKASKIVGDRNNKCELTFVLNGYEYAITADYDTRVATVTVTAVQDITSMQSYSYGVTAPSDPKEGDIWVSETLTEIPIAENANELTFTKTASRYKLTLSGLANNDSAIFEWYRASDSKPFESDEYKPDGTYYFDAPDYEIKDNELCLYLIYTDNLWEVATLWAVANTVYQYHNGSWVAMEVVTATEKAAWNAKQNALTFDSTPTADSTNPVTSGGVKAYVDGAIPTVPTISTDITADATSDAKTTSPKAVKTFVEGKGYGTYSKPSGGIPAADIAAGVIPTVPAISTDITSDATSDTKTASPKAVKTFVENKGYGTYSKPSGGIPASDLASGVIPTVPTISTDIAADKSSTTKTAAPSAVYAEVHPAVASTQPNGGFAPNITYDLGTLTGTVTFALASPTDNTIANPYYWTFETSSTAPTITWPSGLSWSGGSAPTINASKHYEIMVRNGYATSLEFDITSSNQQQYL